MGGGATYKVVQQELGAVGNGKHYIIDLPFDLTGVIGHRFK